MKRTFATMGVVGLAALAVAAPAAADRGGGDNDHQIIICHAGAGSNSGHFTANLVAVPSLNGHDEHSNDIIPPHDGMNHGHNWDEAGRAIHANGCAVLPPVVVPPASDTTQATPPGDTTQATPPRDTTQVAPPGDLTLTVPQVVIPATVPAGAVPDQPATVQPQVNVPEAAQSGPAASNPAANASANTSPGTNRGYNAQTAVGGSDILPSWLPGLGALFAAGAAVAFRRRSGTLPLAG